MQHSATVSDTVWAHIGGPKNTAAVAGILKMWAWRVVDSLETRRFLLKVMWTDTDRSAAADLFLAIHTWHNYQSYRF